MVKLKKIIECFINYKVYKHYFSGVSPLFDLTPLIKEVKQVNTLIDIGSNKGQFSSILRNFFPDILIHSFEPQIDELKIQKRLLGKYNVNYYNFALGNEEKIMEFNITKRKDSSSLLNPIMQNSKIYSKERTINIFVKKLDNILSSDLLKGPILLKLDVQGFELQTLIGAKSFIKNVDYIISEVSYVDVYHNQVNSNKLIEFLNSNNFIIKKRCNLTILNGKKFQEDILFIKKY